MFKRPSQQPALSEFLSSCISMRNTRLLLLLATLFSLCQGALAQEDNREAYAVLDGNGLLKFYYDTNKSDASASGTVYDVPWDSGDYEDPGWITWDNDIMDYIENTDITSVAFDISFREYNLESANAMFASCTALTSIDFTYFNTSNVWNMSYMFYNCSALTNTGLNLSNFNTENVNDMEAMFSGCSGLQTLNLSNFNTLNVLYMSNMFSGCSGLQTLNLSNFNTLNVLYMSNMFSGCSGLQTLNISNFNTENVNDMEAMFSGCSNLQTLNLSNFNTSNVHYMSYMFSGCSGLQTLDLSNFNTSNVEYMSNMFSGCSSLQTLNLSNFNTKYVWNMKEMFHGCSILTTIYCNNDWYKEDVESNDMFSDCTQLVGAVAFDASNANDVSYANPTTGYFTGTALRPYAVFNNGTLTFYYGEYNDDLDVEVYLNFQWELYPAWQEVSENITTVTFDASFINYPISSTAFMFNGLNNLTTINGLEYLNTSNVTDMSYMFSECSLLKTLDLTSFNTENVTYMLYMFAHCYSLSNIYCNDNWNTHEIVSEKMFYVCENLPNYSDFDITKANPTTGYFTYALKDNAENSSLLDRIDDMPRVGLVGRTLYKDGDWNTLCLPFSVNDGDTNDDLTFSGTPLEGAIVMTLDNSADSQTGFDPSSGILTLNFVEVNYIEAGDPYIIKWENSGEKIVNPIFTNVYYGSTAGSFGASGVSFIGTYDPQPLTSANSNILYLGASNTLYYPSANITINAFRAYFELNLTSSQQVKAINLNFGDEKNGIQEITTDSNLSTPSNLSNSYITLDGRRILSQPITPGIYIHNGRKVLIK